MSLDEEPTMNDTADEAYARRLQAKQQVWWKRALNVQAPYQWNLRRQELGRTLDVGCGIGRNLETLAPGSVGVDHNEASIKVARERGVTALTVAEWEQSELRREESFDGMLVAHVIEHMDAAVGEELMRSYLPYLKPGGKVFFICPQERGYDSDPTHVRFTTGEDLAELARTVGLRPDPWFSFPFPRWAGKPFVYNEFCLLAHKPA
jgi:2-polyprenyl-3-methyl-5-hydroxy-6-metoxy-1,4-benzoquinol methylase